MTTMVTPPQPSPILSPKLQPLHVVLFLLAAVLIGRAAVGQNASSLNLQMYERGEANMPYQARYLMVPVLRWAEGSVVMSRASKLLKHSSRGPAELTVQLINAVSLMAMGFVTLRLRNHLSPICIFPWLAPWLLLWITLCTYVARDEMAIYYPYDFLSALVFAAGIVFCIEYRPLLLILAIFAGSYNRETAVFLLPIFLLCNWHKCRWKTFFWAAIGLATFGVARIQIHGWTHHASSGLTIPWRINLLSLLPHHLPQLFSVGGFLCIPMWTRRDLVCDALLRRIWLGVLPLIVSDLIFGWWDETRIFGELNVIFAVTAAIQLEQYLREKDVGLARAI
jgi:hypothetical protein